MTDFPADSRILLLAARLDRRWRTYFPAASPSAEAERRAILALAAQTLPAPDPPDELARTIAASLRRLFLAVGHPPLFSPERTPA